MTRTESTVTLPPIPAKRYFTIGEVSDLCGVKPHVLRYWEQEFTQLKPVKRRGNRRYYQHHEVLLIRRIRSLLYEQGFTISGARWPSWPRALHNVVPCAVWAPAHHMQSCEGRMQSAKIFSSIQHFFCTNACKHFLVLLYSFSFGA